MWKKKPHIPPLVPSGAMSVQYLKRVQTKNGVTAKVFVELCERHYPVLPPPSAFDLEKLLQSGVPLKEENSIVFRNDSLTDTERGSIEALIDKETQDVEPNND